MLINDQNEILREVEERAVLVGFNDDSHQGLDIEYSMAELSELSFAAGVEVVGVTVQNKKTIDAAYYIGSGKVEEVRMLAEANDANLIIFNDELSGAQLRNLEREIGMKIIDRTSLILDIFAKRASSRVSKLQVELAQIRYRLPRLKGMGEGMSKLGAGVGSKGPGEQKLELDKRRIRERITEITKQLDDEKNIRETQRSKRQKNEVPVVALVGYTNAGKSSVMNYLLQLTKPEEQDKKVFEKDMLFATLDTYHRRIDLPDHRSFVLVDTVGFVSKLPHSLVEAFKATLEEVAEADLLIHVMDVTNSNMSNQKYVTDEVLKELGALEKETLFVYNKVDLLENPEEVKEGPKSLKISAKTGYQMDTLVERIRHSIFSDIVKVKMLLPFSEGQVYSYLCDKHHVISTEYTAEGTEIEVEIDQVDLGRYRHFITEGAPDIEEELY